MGNKVKQANLARDKRLFVIDMSDFQEMFEMEVHWKSKDDPSLQYLMYHFHVYYQTIINHQIKSYTERI